ncbi:MAG: phosphatase PAP2 family protein [Acidimicrobiales bacterium]
MREARRKELPTPRWNSVLVPAAWGVAAFLALALFLDFDATSIIIVGLCTALIFGKDRSLQGALATTKDWVGLLVFLLLYAKSRGIADTFGMPVQEESVIAIDRFLGLGETWVHRSQEWIDWDAPPQWWEVTFPLTYATHFLASLGVMVYLYVHNRVTWKRFMSRWVALSAVGLVGYVLLPTVPPWMASENGTTALVREGNPRGWSYVEADFVADLFEFGRDSVNPIAAMPSLHAAYPMLLLLFFGPSRGLLGRLLLSLYCLHMGFAIVISGQHWVIDVFAGWACAVAVHVAFTRRERWNQSPVGVRAGWSSRRRLPSGEPLPA